MVKIFGHNFDTVNVMYDSRWNKYFLITTNYDEGGVSKTVHELSVGMHHSHKYQFSFDAFDNTHCVGIAENNDDIDEILNSIEDGPEKEALITLLSLSK